MRLCATCGGGVGAKRLEAIPSASECTTCASKRDVEVLQGYLTWEHKTAPVLVIASKREVSEVHRLSRKGPRPQLPMSSKTSSAGLQRTENTTGHAVNMLSAKCHPDRPRVSSSGKCIECASKWYSDRSKWK